MSEATPVRLRQVGLTFMAVTACLCIPFLWVPFVSRSPRLVEAISSEGFWFGPALIPKTELVGSVGLDPSEADHVFWVATGIRVLLMLLFGFLVFIGRRGGRKRVYVCLLALALSIVASAYTYWITYCVQALDEALRNGLIKLF
jgi:hypothetical protein